MQISVTDLRQACNLLLDHLEESGTSTVNIAHDFYWVVPEAQRYNPYEEPSHHTLGQLSDDFAEIRSMLHGEKEPLRYALVWVASLLRAAGEVAAR